MTNIDITSIDLDATGTVALRKLARELGIKGQSSARGADLRALIAPIQEHQKEQAAAKAAEAARKIEAPKVEAAKPAKKEKAPKIRKQSLTESDWAGWENSHSDQDHENIDRLTVEQTHFAKEENGEELFTAYVASVREEIERCPICHPELFRARKAQGTTGRYSASRAGMTMNVTRRMSAEEKAKLVAKLLPTSKITVRKSGDVVLTGVAENGAEVDLTFTPRSFNHKASTVGGKKVLNVAAALRAIRATEEA